ncbi:MAG: hypothetical protein ACLFP2_02855 [Candidatus Woesearchaeota archaeon]
MRWVLLVLLMSAFVAADFSESQAILVNSENWQDVYSATLAAELTGKEAFFVTSSDTVTRLIDKLPEKILLIQSNEPVYTGIESLLRSKGIQFDTYPRYNINTELFDELEAQDAIVVDGAYGYDAISVAPYALLTDAYVLFEENVPDDANIVMTYGFVEGFEAPLKINKGNRFDNNIEIVDLFLEKKPTKSLKITNGEFIEKSLFNPEYPVLFIGKSNVPENVEEYLAESDFNIATLIGNDLAPLAKTLKDRLKGTHDKAFTVIAMIGKSGSGGENSIETLDTFPIPVYDAQLSINSVRYNQVAQQLEVTYENENDLRVYFLPSITINSDGERKTAESSLEFLEGEHTKTIAYPMEIQGDSVSGEISVLFGRANNSLERRLNYPVESLDMVEVIDRSNISIEKAVYDRLNKAFKIKVKNTGSVKAYVDIELIDVLIGGEETRLASRNTKEIPAGKTENLIVRADLSSLDMEENDQVEAKAYFSQQKGILFKTESRSLPLEISMNPGIYAAAVAVVVIIIIFLSLRKKKKSIEKG